MRKKSVIPVVLLVLASLVLALIFGTNLPMRAQESPKLIYQINFPHAFKNWSGLAPDNSPTPTTNPTPTAIPPTPTPNPPTPTPTLPPPAGWKGAGCPWQHQSGPVEPLGISWYYNWKADGGYQGAWDPLYVPMVWGKEWEGKYDQLQALAAAHPGRHWLILNEPECYCQANLSPSEAAKVWDAAYEAIKAGDPTAKVGGFGVHQIFADGRTQNPWNGSIDYILDLLNHAKHKPDFYAVHDWYARYEGGMNGPYTLTWKALENHIALVRSYLGYDIPVWITETGGLLGPGGTWEEARDSYMAALMNWLYNKGFSLGIKRVAWFASYWDDGGLWKSSLYETDPNAGPPTLSIVGIAWKAQ